MPTKRGPVDGEAPSPAEVTRVKKTARSDGVEAAFDETHSHSTGRGTKAFSMSSSSIEDSLGHKELANGIPSRASVDENNENVCESEEPLQMCREGETENNDVNVFEVERLEESPQYETETEERDGSSCSIDGSSSETEELSDKEEDLKDEPGKKRTDDSTAFGRAFQKIMRKKLPVSGHNDAMGPILSAHKQLVAKKLEEAEEGRKKRSESKKEKQALREKGHFVPPSYVTAKEKELIRLATRGVVKLFNAVSKVQSLEAGAKSTNKAEAKELAKRNKSTFLSMLQGANGSTFEEKKQPSNNKEETMAQHQPGWSALQETFMLGKARLKDWDKKQDDEIGLERTGDSSDDSD